MKCKLITTVSDPTHTGWLMLKKSLDKFGWDYEICGTQYHQFGSKMVNAYYYAKKTDCTHLFIVDAYDVIVFGTMQEAMEKAMKILDNDAFWGEIFGAETNAWPYEQWAMLYPEVKSKFKYLNGGLAFVEVEKFISMIEENPVTVYDNDQVILAKTYLTNNKYCIRLDTSCELFQNLCGTNWDEFIFNYNGIYPTMFPGIFNIETKTRPIFFHGNGRHPMDKIYELI